MSFGGFWRLQALERLGLDECDLRRFIVRWTDVRHPVLCNVAAQNKRAYMEFYYIVTFICVACKSGNKE